MSPQTPQPDDDRIYLRIPDELDRAYAMSRLTSYDRRLLQYIREYSLVFDDEFSNSDDIWCEVNVSGLARRFGVPRAKLSYCLNSLLKDGLLIRSGRSFTLQLDFSMWSRDRISARDVALARKGDAFVPPETQKKVREAIPQSLRTLVFERDAYRCRYCGGHKDLCIDHVVPLSKGGPTTLDNLQTLCRPCNSAKCDRPDFIIDILSIAEGGDDGCQ